MMNELVHIRKVAIRLSLLFLLLVVIFFAVPFGVREVRGFQVIVPVSVDSGGITPAVYAVQRIQKDLTPKGAQFAVFSPLEPFTAQATIACLLAFMLVLPVLLLESWIFLRPALYPKERRVLAWVLVAGAFFSFVGTIFAYKILMPLVFGALFAYLPVGVLPLFNLSRMITLVAGFILAVSLIFLLPIVMTLLTTAGFVPSQFWRTHARHAMLLSIIVSAIITPDGSGVSMVLLSVPIGVLYAVGVVGSSTIIPIHTRSSKRFTNKLTI